MSEIKRMRNILMIITFVGVKIQLNLYECQVFLNSCEFSSRFGFLLLVRIEHMQLEFISKFALFDET